MQQDDVCARLYRMPRHSEKPPKTANDALISDLPADTLRWIKNRRRLDCDAKMVLSHHREHQLRDIFNGIDVGNNGSIDLEELHEAVCFVSERLKNRIGSFSGFSKVLEIFNSMDDNGDGQVDFQEFTNAMSGSSKSALDKASEQDIANLHRCFLEFGVMKSRRYAIAKINEYTGLSFAGESATNFKSAFEEEQRQKAKKAADTVDDLKQYQLFRTLFEEKRDIGSLIAIASAEDAKPGDEEKVKKYTVEEIMLKEFQEENRRMHLTGTNDPAKEAEYDALHERLRQAREHEAMLLARDPDNLLMHVGHKESLKYFAEKRRKQRKNAVNSSTLRTVDGKPIPNSLFARTAPVVPPPNTRNDMAVHLQAKKDAYDILRSLRYLTPLEKERRLQGTAHSTIAIPPPIEIPVDTDNDETFGLSSKGSTRSTSNLPTSRKNRQRSALQQSRSLDAMLCDSDRPSTAPAKVTLTPHAALQRPVTPSPKATSRLLFFPNNSRPDSARRPSTANVINRTANVITISPAPRPASGVQRLRLRSPKHMRGSVL